MIDSLDFVIANHCEVTKCALYVEMAEIERHNVNPSYGLLENDGQENEIVEPVYEDILELDIVVPQINRRQNGAIETVASARKLLQCIRLLSCVAVFVILISTVALFMAIASLVVHAQLLRNLPVNVTLPNLSNFTTPTNSELSLMTRKKIYDRVHFAFRSYNY